MLMAIFIVLIALLDNINSFMSKTQKTLTVVLISLLAIQMLFGITLLVMAVVGDSPIVF